MADYKRFVSYMYEYENGVKKKNVGYVRVEIRNGECRFTIHMQLDGLPEGIFPTYLIHRPTDEMDLVYLGDCTVKNQIMDSKLSAKEYNTMDSGYRFSDMGGILLFLNSGVFYATQWDDKPVVLEEVLHALKPKPKSKSPTDIREEVKENAPEANDKLLAAKIPTVIKPEPSTPEKRPADTIPVLIRKPAATEPTPVKKPAFAEPVPVKKPVATEPMSVKTPIADAPTFDNKTLEEKADTAKNKEDNEASRPKYILPGGGMMNTGVLHSRPKTPTNPWELVERYKKAEGNHIASKAIDNVERPMEKAMDINAEKTIKGESPLAARIFANYPRIYPFEDNEVTRCVKVEPKDIGALPSDTWILSNNSFLLHGYYCYHHLIFAEISDRYGCRYILGVPGIFHNRERFMARMFGFECFKSIRKRELKQGDFGYWYLEVNF